MSREPFANRCSNAGHYDRWTCPGCYHDLDVKEPGQIKCPECERTLTLSLDYEPVCTAKIVDDDEGDEE